jgi:Bardet-Biedl syndrome 9 protein
VPVDATILVSKNGGRYRVQSSSLPALWMITSELCTRLNEHWSRNTGGGDEKDAEADDTPLLITYTEPLPLQDFYNAIDQHFERRLELRSALSDLNDCAHQFRIIEKRLLVRFKDRNPAPLSQLDSLMHETYRQLLDLSNRVVALRQRLASRLARSDSGAPLPARRGELDHARRVAFARGPVG